ncbi:hypothetical protein [Okeania sp. SIO2B3]|uniref:hypothetical protein n=1 Tax=Okeania sp. SIO2B3 TaxID=2607784 RepID=UPI0013C07E8C|nr:hypothetical protein [Okeania sp. SIO2B3]NET42694.1 hypothetical protein [Okeania sp. SIO2B3]
MRHPQQRGEVGIFPPPTSNLGASQNEMTIATSATERGSRYSTRLQDSALPTDLAYNIPTSQPKICSKTFEISYQNIA